MPYIIVAKVLSFNCWIIIKQYDGQVIHVASDGSIFYFVGSGDP